MISCVDQKLGRLLDVLEDTNLADNTLVIFTSDHGEMLGERGMWLKMCMYEWSVRVPLVISYPGKFPAARIPHNVSLVDLLPTLIDVVSLDSPIPEPGRLDGHSMRSLLETGRDADWPDTVVSDFNAGGMPGPLRMVKRGQYKYVHLFRNDEMLFDLEADPDEMTNLADQSGYAAILQELRTLALAGYDPEAVYAEVRASQERRLFIKGLDGDLHRAGNWSFEARPGDSSRFVRGGGLVSGEHATKARSRFPYVQPASESPEAGA
jgi:choline-sulfatase